MAEERGRREQGEDSDERDAYRNVRRLSPLGRVLAHEVFHDCVFGHVLHQVGLLLQGTHTQ